MVARGNMPRQRPTVGAGSSQREDSPARQNHVRITEAFRGDIPHGAGGICSDVAGAVPLRLNFEVTEHFLTLQPW